MSMSYLNQKISNYWKQRQKREKILLLVLLAVVFVGGGIKSLMWKHEWKLQLQSQFQKQQTQLDIMNAGVSEFVRLNALPNISINNAIQVEQIKPIIAPISVDSQVIINNEILTVTSTTQQVPSMLAALTQLQSNYALTLIELSITPASPNVLVTAKFTIPTT